MLHTENQAVRDLLLKGNFGLEKESLRVLDDGSFAHTPHPFPNDPHIVKDFCENQTEINTGVHGSAAGAIAELEYHDRRIHEKLEEAHPAEYLWPFSNPPHISGARDIPIAVYEGSQAGKMEYRRYLSWKYGRYKMTFSGIHVNYSFSNELLEADYDCARADGTSLSMREYRDSLYLELAQALAAAGWILVAVTAASPVMDGSFIEKDLHGRDAFIGMASVRCSELGYWNDFAPIFDYSSLEAYLAGIRRYVDSGLLRAPTELYYPIRLKPAGENTLEALAAGGVSHVEMRMFDLNPLAKAGVEERDVVFAQLLITWLVSTPPYPFTAGDQVNAIRNFKNASHYDLKTVRMLTPFGADAFLADAAVMLIGEMKDFYAGIRPEVLPVLDFELAKFTEPENRYAWRIRKEFGEGFAVKALELAKRRHAEIIGSPG